MILKIKAFIYKRTGIYLAHKEELAYLKSKECWQSFAKIYKSEQGSMLPRDIQGLLIGLWQCENGFTRPLKRESPAKRARKAAKRNKNARQ